MSRSGYSEDWGCDNTWDMVMWRGAVSSAIRGKRGQAFLKEMLAALDKMASKRLIGHELVKDGEACAIGTVALARGMDVSAIDPDDRDSVANAFGIAPALAAEIEFENDQDFSYRDNETPEARYTRMRQWIVSQIKPDK